MFEKAMAMGDKETAYRIARGNMSPNQAKNLGRQVKNYDEKAWSKKRVGVMHEGLMYKTKQHPDVRKLLIETTTKTIVEASSTDHIWGIGMSKNHLSARDPSKWRGSNLLGKTWMDVRREIRMQESMILKEEQPKKEEEAEETEAEESEEEEDDD